MNCGTLISLLCSLLINRRQEANWLVVLGFNVEVKPFTEFTVHRGSAVTIRFTILFLRVSIRLGSLKCKQTEKLGQLDR